MRHLIVLPLLLAAGRAPADPGAERIEIDLSNFKFSPASFSMRSGARYTLHLVNRSGGGHDFVAKSFFARAVLAPADRALVRRGEVEQGGGETRDIALVAPAAGRYEVHCSHFMHETFGMKAVIDVRP